MRPDSNRRQQNLRRLSTTQPSCSVIETLKQENP